MTNIFFEISNLLQIDSDVRNLDKDLKKAFFVFEKVQEFSMKMQTFEKNNKN
jgi:hypothetical protein